MGFKQQWLASHMGQCFEKGVRPNRPKLEQLGNALQITTQGKVTFHDLRHSYAIALLQKGATMEQTARALGDSIGVCQEYYAGYTLTLTELAGFKKIL